MRASRVAKTHHHQLEICKIFGVDGVRGNVKDGFILVVLVKHFSVRRSVQPRHQESLLLHKLTWYWKHQRSKVHGWYYGTTYRVEIEGVLPM